MHLRNITKGEYGDVTKVREELEELEDALEQNIHILAVIELSDLYGALEGLAITLGVTMSDLKDFSDAVKRDKNGS